MGMLALVCCRGMSAQPTNLEIFQDLAIACIEPVPGETRLFQLDATDSMPYLRSALVSQWNDTDYRVYLVDTLRADPLPTLSYHVDEARVSYERLRRKRVARTVALTMQYSFVDADGILLQDNLCAKDEADTLAVSDLDRVESDAYPETTAPLPARRWLRGYLEPIILTAASAISVYLFFTLRSDSDNDEG